MKQLIVFCEGSTEQGFCRQVLQPHLYPSGLGVIHTLAVGRKSHYHVYGIRSYAMLRTFIRNTLRQRHDNDLRFTTLIDLYGLPDDFPGKRDHKRDPNNPVPYVQCLEQAFGVDINDHRFIPHLQLHEYEAMLFAGPEAFARSFENREEAIERLKDIANSCSNAEHINDGVRTSPSKRIIEVIPEYGPRKASAGPDIAQHIGLAAIRAACPHFDAWITTLEQLAQPAP